MKLRQQLHQIFKRRHRHSAAPKKQGGFTLTELLVVIAIAGVIVSALMGLVVELIGTEQRESSRTETQRSMQLALNYITSELEQAIYIYDADPHPVVGASQPSYMSFLPEKFEDEDYRPVVAFWMPRAIDVAEASDEGGLPEFDQCRTEFSGDSDQEQRLRRECQNIWKQRRAYSLVVYFQVPKDTANANDRWDGESRIVRYELPKFRSLTASNAADVFDRHQGFVDPAELGSNSFAAWPYSGDTNCQAESCVDGLPGAGGRPDLGATSPKAQVLVDFVDDPDSTRADSDGTASEPTTCNAGYDRIPAADSGKPSSSFFVCLQDNGGRFGEPQDVVVYLRGNAKGRGGNRSDAFLPTLQTRIAMRGVIDKDVGAAARASDDD